jgi:hypothetical protein
MRRLRRRTVGGQNEHQPPQLAGDSANDDGGEAAPPVAGPGPHTDPQPLPTARIPLQDDGDIDENVDGGGDGFFDLSVAFVTALAGGLVTVWAVCYLLWHLRALLAEEHGEPAWPEPQYFSWYTALHRAATEQEITTSLHAMGYREK